MVISYIRGYVWYNVSSKRALFSISIDMFDLLIILGVRNNEFKTNFLNIYLLHISIDIKVRLWWSGHLKENLAG